MERRLDRSLRSALTHLHDLPYLQTHPLESRRGKELQRLLQAGLDEMGAGRTAELLRLRYAEALPSNEVATRLGISQGGVLPRARARPGRAGLDPRRADRIGAAS